MKTLIFFLIVSVLFTHEPNKKINIRVLLLNEKKEILKLGTIMEYSNSISIHFSPHLNLYILDSKSDSLSFYITHPGYESIKFKTLLDYCSSSVYYEFEMKKKLNYNLGN